VELGGSDGVADADFAMSLSDFWRRTAYFEGAPGTSFYPAASAMLPIVLGGSLLNYGFDLRSIATGSTSITSLLWVGLGCANVRYFIKVVFVVLDDLICAFTGIWNDNLESVRFAWVCSNNKFSSLIFVKSGEKRDLIHLT
jgi:hypothetical protein